MYRFKYCGVAAIVGARSHAKSTDKARQLAQGRFEWNLTSSTIMASAVSDQILRKPMADVEPMH
jgi:hypothetical protein